MEGRKVVGGRQGVHSLLQAVCQGSVQGRALCSSLL